MSLTLKLSFKKITESNDANVLTSHSKPLEISIGNDVHVVTPQPSYASSNQKRKVAEFFKQILILMWKNSILFKRNISGTIAEICVALIFVLILFLVRALADTSR